MRAPPSPPAPLVIAHRGASRYELENSLSAFHAAVALGADAIELDVHASADGCLFVHHEDTIPPDHHIPTLSSTELRGLRLANGEPVPTLEQALGAAGSLAVFIEVKSLDERFDARLFAAIHGGPNPGGYAVHSFDHRIVRRLGALRPRLARGVLSSSYPVAPLAALAETGATTLWQERSMVDRALADLVHGIGGRLFVWTVDAPEEMRRLIALGVDGLCSNVPDIARNVVSQVRGRA